MGFKVRAIGGLIIVSGNIPCLINTHSLTSRFIHILTYTSHPLTNTPHAQTPHRYQRGMCVTNNWMFLW